MLHPGAELGSHGAQVRRAKNPCVLLCGGMQEFKLLKVSSALYLSQTGSGTRMRLTAFAFATARARGLRGAGARQWQRRSLAEKGATAFATDDGKFVSLHSHLICSIHFSMIPLKFSNSQIHKSAAKSMADAAFDGSIVDKARFHGGLGSIRHHLQSLPLLALSQLVNELFCLC